MSPSPIGTLTLTASGLDDCLSNKYKMNILSNQENNVNTFNLNSSDLSFDTDSPEISQSPSNYSSQSSLTCSPKKISSVTKSIDIKNTSNGCIKNTFENTIQTPTSNDMLFESLNSASFSLSFDKISNSSFMDYFNLPESYSVSPSINYNLSINNASELKENESGNCCLYSISNNNDVKMRKKKISFSSNNCLFPNFDDFDLNFDQCDTKNASENVKILEQHDDDKLKAEKLLELSDLSVDDSDEINQIDNHDTLIAIREMAILERRSKQRKHKNSTSSVSSASMSSRIKKFAIDLQNTTSNVTLDNQNFKPVPIYTSNSNNTNAPKNSFKIEYLLNSLPDHDGLFANDLDIDRFNIDVDDTDLSQILELEGWEQMLDEDCISRLTTDFSNQNFLTKRSIDETNRNSDNSEKHNDQSNFQARNQAVNEIKIDSFETNEVLKSSEATSNNSINCDQVDSNSNFKMLSSNSIPAYLKLPTRPVLNSTTSISRIQNMSNTTKKSQPVVVVLSSASSSKVGNKSSSLTAAAGVSLNETKSSNQSKQINIENKTSKIQILNSIKNNNSLNQSLTITNNQIKRLNLSENFNESSIKNEEKIFFSKQTQENGETLDKTDLKKTNVKNVLNNNTDTESKMHCGNVAKLDGDASTSMPSSLIDPIIEVIDCINPDQIFPTRIANKKDNSSGIDSVKSWTKTSTYLENNLKTEHFDEEDDEEIDVVSINQNNNNNCLNFNNNNSDLKTKNNTELRSNNFIKNKETTLDHHNYFNQPSTLAVQSNNITGNRKTQMNFQNKTGSQPSLLAKCLKSTNSNNDIFTKQDFSNKYSKNFTILGEKKQILSSLSKTTNFNESNSSFKVSDGPGDFKNSLVNNSNTPISSISKSLSSPVLKKSANLLFNTVNLDQSRKNSIFSSSNNFLPNTSPNITENNPSARNLSQKSLTNPIRILTTSINNSNSAIRQINQTTTLCSNQNILANSSINKGKLSNIIHIPTQSISNNNNLFNNSVGNLSNTFTKNCKNSNKSETKIFTTTLIAKHQNVNKITNSTSFKRISSNFKNFSVKNENNNENMSILEVKSNDANLETRIIDDQTNNLLFEKCEISTDYDFDINQTKNIEGDNVNDNESNEITDESDEDDDEDDDEESCNIVSSLHNNSNLSPLSLTSNGYSNASSGCSTPIKARVNKNKNNNKLISELSDKRFDKIPLSEKLRYKKKRKTKQLCSMTGLPSNSIKRNSRLNLLGYSSENPAEKRAFHILSERQRRNDLKKLFETLRTNIPNLCDKQKASKLTILKAAVDHLMEVSNKKEKLSVIFDKEKQKNTILMQNLKNLQQSLNVSNGHSIPNSNCYSHTKPGSTIATLFVH